MECGRRATGAGVGGVATTETMPIGCMVERCSAAPGTCCVSRTVTCGGGLRSVRSAWIVLRDGYATVSHKVLERYGDRRYL
jgi:hypothetical protein